MEILGAGVRPEHGDVLSLSRGAESEVDVRFTGRAVAVTGLDQPPLPIRSGADTHLGAEGIPAGFVQHPETDGVAAVTGRVPQQPGRAAVVDDHDVDIAVAVVIGVGGRPGVVDDRGGRATLRQNLLESAVPEAPEELVEAPTDFVVEAPADERANPG